MFVEHCSHLWISLVWVLFFFFMSALFTMLPFLLSFFALLLICLISMSMRIREKWVMLLSISIKTVF